MPSNLTLIISAAAGIASSFAVCSPAYAQGAGSEGTLARNLNGLGSLETGANEFAVRYIDGTDIRGGTAIRGLDRPSLFAMIKCDRDRNYLEYRNSARSHAANFVFQSGRECVRATELARIAKNSCPLNITFNTSNLSVSSARLECANAALSDSNMATVFQSREQTFGSVTSLENLHVTAYIHCGEEDGRHGAFITFNDELVQRPEVLRFSSDFECNRIREQAYVSRKNCPLSLVLDRANSRVTSASLNCDIYE